MTIPSSLVAISCVGEGWCSAALRFGIPRALAKPRNRNRLGMYPLAVAPDSATSATQISPDVARFANNPGLSEDDFVCVAKEVHSSCAPSVMMAGEQMPTNARGSDLASVR